MIQETSLIRESSTLDESEHIGLISRQLIHIKCDHLNNPDSKWFDLSPPSKGIPLSFPFTYILYKTKVQVQYRILCIICRYQYCISSQDPFNPEQNDFHTRAPLYFQVSDIIKHTAVSVVGLYGNSSLL